MIERNKRKNYQNEPYIPDGALASILNLETVKEILQETSLRHDQVHELSQIVLSGGIKTFSILLLVGQLERILALVEDDQMQSRDLDQRLPLSLEKLLTLLGDANAAAGFYNQQWPFIAPVFSRSSLPRVLNKKTILPFINQSCIGEGGFGQVYKVTIDPSHHSLTPDKSHVFVRKELKAEATTPLDYELELRNLSTLRLLKHPYLIDLLSCFTYQDKHNFMLPLADGGSLAELLAGERPSPFESNNDIFISCCGVVSAIRAVHNYFADGVEALGCHRDLKPSNILLDGTKFVLADFGLSRFKQLEEGSASQFKAGRGDYLAPECEDLGEPFEKHVVQRSSDMWSLGCILSEILTLILKGLKGVETFRSRRCFKVGHFKYRLFHCGPQTENPHVWEWFGDLEQEATEHTRTFLSVVKELLVLDPTRRPNISVLDLHLRRLTIEALAGEVATLYCQLYVRYRTTPALVEWYRFWSWSTVVQESKQPIPFLAAKSFEDFAMIIVTLQNLKQDLEATPLEQTKFIRGALLPLRKMNDLLLNALPNHCARRAREHFEASMLESEDPNALEDLSKSLSQNSAVADARLIHLAKVKRLKLLAEETPLHAENRRPPINVATIENAGWLELIYKGWLTQHEGDKQKQSVLVETKSYDEPLVTAEDTCELLARLEAMADLLNEAQSFRVLPCLGFYNDPLTYSLGLVYKCPIAHQTGKTTVSTLHEILERARAERGSKRPSLGDRFKLAHTLALSVLEFHKVGWSQKTISSFNIVFCKPADEHWTAYMTEPSFLGYIASRQDEEGAFTEGPADDERLRRYLCPEYLIDWKRYEQHFDYYGLGLVLLELGLWSTIDGLLPDEEKKQRQPEELRVWLLRKAVPGLGQTMGKIYEKAVDECLRWQLSPFNAPVESSRASNWLRFSETVVEKLASCRA